MAENADAMVLASFAADALALGAHWIYDTRQIDARLGRVTDFLKPSPPTYHPTKARGELTHYGDQTLVLLRSVSACGGFDEDHFGRCWREFFRTYSGYFDGATKQTLVNLDAGKKGVEAASTSDDLAGAARIAPLVYCYWKDHGQLVDSARRQTGLTHNSPAVLAGADFFSRVACRVLQAVSPAEAMEQVATETAFGEPIRGWISAGLSSAAEDTRSTVRRFGQMCEIAAAFPATVHLIAKYENRLEDGLIENVMAGGDSAGRGLLAGLVLGAWGGRSAIPERWLSGLVAAQEITRLLAQIQARGEA
ncbi:MAG: ADP-ribosylglycohydrolase family protein [Deltaproteobacteria bacterium]|nr:ADP-ribosylglycohydrolase family protein [Deltaproteobacteria bacterium]